MPRHWTESITAFHPLLLAGILAMVLMFGVLLGALKPAYDEVQAGAHLATWVTMPSVFITGAWSHGLHHLAVRAMAEKADALPHRKVFSAFLAALGVITGITLSMTYFPEDYFTAPAKLLGQLSIVVLALSFITLTWSAAATLIQCERNGVVPPAHKTIGAFLLISYLPIGIWFLHGRVERLRRLYKLS